MLANQISPTISQKVTLGNETMTWDLFIFHLTKLFPPVLANVSGKEVSGKIA